MEGVWAANSRLRKDYQEMWKKADSIRSTAEEKARKKN
jgi:hypothetical protein